MTRITLSVVIPAYNEAAFIGTLLERIQAVDLAGVAVTPELIVVDDGSADATAEIAERHGGVRVIRQRPNAG
jgi:glycosyltransferase involved in cell wall biosynthesis